MRCDRPLRSFKRQRCLVDGKAREDRLSRSLMKGPRCEHTCWQLLRNIMQVSLARPKGGLRHAVTLTSTVHVAHLCSWPRCVRAALEQQKNRAVVPGRKWISVGCAGRRHRQQVPPPPFQGEGSMLICSPWSSCSKCACTWLLLSRLLC